MHMKDQNRKRNYRKLFIPALVIVSSALLALGCYFYNTIIIEFPATASMVSIFVSNYTLLMISMAIALHFNGFDIAKNKTSVFYKGVILIVVSLLVVILLIGLACCMESSEQGCKWLIFILDNGYRQNLLIPTVLAAVSALGAALISDSAYNKRNQTR